MLEKLSLSDLLRYGYSGGVFLITSQVTYAGLPWNNDLAGSINLAEGGGLALVAVVIGSFIYSLHMALVHDWITRLLLCIRDDRIPILRHLLGWITRLFRCILSWKYLKLLLPENSDSFRAKSFERDYWRWVRRSTSVPEFQQNWDKWVSQIHFLYGSAWATLMGAILGGNLSGSHRFGCTVFVVVGVASFLGAVFQDFKALYYETKIMEMEKKKVSDDIKLVGNAAAESRGDSTQA